jgi:hypothetical protein
MAIESKDIIRVAKRKRWTETRRALWTFTLVTAFFSTLLGVERSEAQPPPAPAPDFTVSETRTEGANQGEWDVTTEVKNNTGSKETIVWWSWPAAKGGAKIGDLTWYPPGTVPEDPDPSKPGHKLPKKSSGATNPGKEIPANGKLDGKTTKKKEPHSVYARVFKKKADGTWEQMQVIAHNVHLAAFNVPTTNPRSEYMSIPIRIPYPTDLADINGFQPADFYVTDVSLPFGWETALIAPAIGEKFELHPLQREFTGVLVLKMADTLAEGDRTTVGVSWESEFQGVVNYGKNIENIVIRDNTPPTLSMSTAAHPEGLLVTVNVQDPGGIHHAVHLTKSTEGPQGANTEVCFVPLIQVLDEDERSEIGVTAAMYQTVIPNPAMNEALTLQASAVDQFGNSTTSPLEVIVGGTEGSEGFDN